jgi:hypothetical protein
MNSYSAKILAHTIKKFRRSVAKWINAAAFMYPPAAQLTRLHSAPLHPAFPSAAFRPLAAYLFSCPHLHISRYCSRRCNERKIDAVPAKEVFKEQYDLQERLLRNAIVPEGAPVSQQPSKTPKRLGRY